MSPHVAIFATCLGDGFFAEATADAVRLLRHLGCAVSYPAGQSCCGQPAFNAGYMDEARAVARHTVEVFQDADYVVLPSGSCAGMLRTGYPRLLGSGAAELGRRSYELSQFIVQVLDVSSVGDALAGKRVAYHHGCHALRELGVADEPVGLLTAAGAEVVAWEADRECCGFGGLFSAKLPAVSVAMADRKLDTLPEVDVVTSTDGGCLMQLSGRAGKRGDGPAFRHLASLLWEATGIRERVSAGAAT